MSRRGRIGASPIGATMTQIENKELKTYHYFYKITNKINGMFYYGIHCTNNLDDGYMGSGRRIIAAIKKYGVENFEKEILKYFDSLKELSDYETQIVNEDLLNDPMCYNLIKGGYFLEDEVLRKLKNTYKEIKHQQGEKNSQYGTCWITKDGESKKINKDELNNFICDGWIKGRVIKNKEKIIKSNSGRRHVWKEGKCIQIYEKDLQKYLDDGWVIGRKDPTQLKREKKNKLSEEEYKEYCKKRKEKFIEYNKTHIKVRDVNGNVFMVEKTDPRYLSGELVSFNKGMIAAKDENGNSYFISIDDPRYLSGELIAKNRSNAGKVTIRNIHTNKYYQVDKNDPRLNDENFVTSTTGLKYTDEQRKKIKDAKTKKKMTWINNGYIHKFIPIDEVDQFLLENKDWEIGRIRKN